MVRELTNHDLMLIGTLSDPHFISYLQRLGPFHSFSVHLNLPAGNGLCGK